MQTAQDLCDLVSVFLGRDIGTRFSPTRLRAVTGLDDDRLSPLLEGMRQDGWIAAVHVGDDPNPGLRWVLTEHGHHALAGSHLG